MQTWTEGFDRLWDSAGDDRAVVEKHRGAAVVVVVREPVADQRPACIDCRAEVVLFHGRDRTDDRLSGIQRRHLPCHEGSHELTASAW